MQANWKEQWQKHQTFERMLPTVLKFNFRNFLTIEAQGWAIQNKVPFTHNEINKLFTDVGLDKTLKPNNMMTEFPQRPEQAQYLSDCAQERT